MTRSSIGLSNTRSVTGAWHGLAVSLALALVGCGGGGGGGGSSVTPTGTAAAPAGLPGDYHGTITIVPRAPSLYSSETGTLAIGIASGDFIASLTQGQAGSVVTPLSPPQAWTGPMTGHLVGNTFTGGLSIQGCPYTLTATITGTGGPGSTISGSYLSSSPCFGESGNFTASQ